MYDTIFEYVERDEWNKLCIHDFSIWDHLGYGTEEVIEFCVDFIPDLDPIGILESRHEGRLSEKGTLGKKTYIGTGDNYFNKAHYTVLQNSSLVEPYVKVHKDFLRSQWPEE